MKPIRQLLVLCCVTALAAPAPVTAALSALPFHGVLYQAAGACVVDRSPDGSLDLSNIGSSGQDGVSFSCLHLDGMSVALSGASTFADAGSSATFTYAWSLVSKPQGSRAQLSLSRPALGSPAVISANLADFALPGTVHCVLSRNGRLVVDKPGTYQVSVVATDPLGRVNNPRFGVALTRQRAGGASLGGTSQVHASASFPSTVTVQFADGTALDCDDVDFVCGVDPADENCDGRSADLQVSASPGSSFSHVRCDDGSCRLLDHDLSCTGGSVVSMSPAPAIDRLGRPTINTALFTGADGFVISDSPRFTVSQARPQAPRSSAGAGGRSQLRFAWESLVFDPAVDEGASLAITIQGSNFSSAGAVSGVSGICVMTVVGHAFAMGRSVSLASAAPESAAVLDHGVEVARYGLQSGFIYATPSSGARAIAVSSVGLRTSGWNLKENVKAAQAHAGPASADVVAGQLLPRLRVGSCPVSCRFATSVQFSCDGQTRVGDEVVRWSAVPDDGSATDWSSLGCRVAAPAAAPSLHSLQLLGVTRDLDDAVYCDMSAASAPVLSDKIPYIDVPFTLDRTDPTGVRGYSVLFHLSPELVSACASTSACVTEGDYLSRVASTQMFVTDNGGGSFTVDCSVLGPVCGATGSGQLFSLRLAAAQPVSGGYGLVTVDDVQVRDCSNHPVACDPGGEAIVPLDFTPPGQLPMLSAAQQKSGNAPGSLTAIQLSWPPPGPLESVHLFVKGFGNYPGYAHGAAPGAVPPLPVSSADAIRKAWLPANFRLSSSLGASGPVVASYDPASRDFLYFCAFVVDEAGNESPVSNRTAGTLDYALADVTNGLSACSGDNHVTLADVTFLGAHYGAAAPPGSSFSCLDFAPTSDFSVDALPVTDGRLNFEELMVLSMNYSVVSAPQLKLRPSPLAANATRLPAVSLPAVGGTFDLPLQFDGAGDALGVSVKLDYNHDVLEQVGVSGGALLESQGRAGVAFTSEPGDVDVALLGAGEGISGSGELARVTFRVKATGDAALSIRSVTARDARNHPVPIAGIDGSGLAVSTGLGFSFPNPFTQSTAIRLSLRQEGDVKLAVYDIAGRRVRVLLGGVQPAGARTITWDGRDDAGLRMAPGAYMVRLDTAGRRESRTLRLVR